LQAQLTTIALIVTLTRRAIILDLLHYFLNIAIPSAVEDCRNILRDSPFLRMPLNEYPVPQHYPDSRCRSHFDILMMVK